ncbi:unnamed protein product [Effrenium voratum]|uniref:SMB domain-containing protein n=1 Tax=Effrenium voratum TaxID=2562239 RepID=A0AA36NEN4_9DINO|nr:unnamed protein product [Effrenium voratum]CAJ1447126.1 unnamed protein product [Effrenium voratum]
MAGNSHVVPLQIGDGDTYSRRRVWLGHEFVDEETMLHVKGVIFAAAIMAGFQVLALLLAPASGHHGQGSLLSFLWGMLLPVCGYLGATRNNACLMGCFTWMSLLSAIAQLLTLCYVLLAVAVINSNEEELCDLLCVHLGCNNHSTYCSCEIGCHEGGCCADFEEVCSAGVQLRAPASCGDIESSLKDHTRIVSVMMLLISPPVIGLSAYAWFHGRKLWSRLAQGDVVLADAANPAEEQE